MKKGISFSLFCLFASILALQGCKGTQGDNSQPQAVKFPQVQVPSYISDQQQAVNFLAKNFWDKFFTSPAEKSPKNGKHKENGLSGIKNAVHGVDSLSFEEAFGMYAQLLGMSGQEVVQNSVRELFANLDSLAKIGERKPLLKVMELSEHYFYNPNSPVLNEEIYLCALNGILAAESLSELDKMQYEYQHRICSLNRAGTPAADFEFRQLVAGSSLPDSNTKMFSETPPKGYSDKTLYKDVKGKYTLLFFNNPDCGACGEILDAIKNSHLTALVEQKQLTIVAMYIDEDFSAWAKNREKYPAEWIYAFDRKLVLRDNNIYGLRAIPSLYLLDEEKKVILKDATIDMIIRALE